MANTKLLRPVSLFKFVVVIHLIPSHISAGGNSFSILIEKREDAKEAVLKWEKENNILDSFAFEVVQVSGEYF